MFDPSSVDIFSSLLWKKCFRLNRKVSNIRQSSHDFHHVTKMREVLHNTCAIKMRTVNLRFSAVSGGSRISPRWGRHYTLLPKFPQNCMKLKEFGRGRGRPKFYYVDLPLHNVFLHECIKLWGKTHWLRFLIFDFFWYYILPTHLGAKHTHLKALITTAPCRSFSAKDQWESSKDKKNRNNS